jgi:hypothetical protein
MLALVLTVAPLAPARAQEAAGSERHAVLAAVDSLLEAMSRRDVAASRRLLVPGAVFQSIRDAGTPGRPQIQGDSAYLRSLAADTSALRERYWEPTTQIAGTLAQVWAPYDFHVNGAFSHCGVDSFSLFKTASGWQIASISYTVKQHGCARSPLGPLAP